MPMTTTTIFDALNHISRLVEARFGPLEPRRIVPPEPTSYPDDHVAAASHVLWLVQNAKAMLLESTDRREKIMRHLAFCQGWLWTMGMASIEELREANRPPEE